MKNWFGIEPHVTDTYIHWTEKDPIKVSVKLRENYDKIKSAGLEKELDFLLSVSYDSGCSETEDSYNEDL